MRVLLYGGPNAGKTWTATSSFWDHDGGAAVRDGRLLRIGAEHNPAIYLPDDYVFAVPSDPEQLPQVHERVLRFLTAYYQACRQEGGPKVLVVDGISEWSALYEAAREMSLQDWKDYKHEFLRIISLLSAISEHSLVVCTARITERKKAMVSRTGQTLTTGDPAWQDFQYYPEMSGYARFALGYYFHLVIYMDVDVVDANVNGRRRRVGVHKAYLLPEGDFLVKNVWERQWLKADLPTVLTNPKFDDILSLVQKAASLVGGGAAAKSK